MYGDVRWGEHSQKYQTKGVYYGETYGVLMNYEHSLNEIR